MRVALIVVAACVLLSGCDGLTVKRETDSGAARQDGLPFYVKRAVLLQQTKVAHYDYLITYQVSDKGDFSKAAVHPATGAVHVPMTDSANAVEDNLRSTLSIAIGKNDFPSEAAAERNLDPVLIDLASSKGNYFDDVVANTWKTDTVLDPTRYYITNRVPAFGSASAEFDLASDGTLTKATTSITDDTAKNLLALAPVTKLLGGGAAATAQSVANGSTVGTKSAERAHFRVLVTIQKVPTIYTLQRIFEPNTCDRTGAVPEIVTATAAKRATFPAKCSVLTVAEGTGGVNGVQLVSVETGGDKKDDKPAYKVSGTIVPPEPPKP